MIFRRIFFAKNIFDLRINLYKSAFTLAEILITLAIIGLVFDMAVPTMVSDVNSYAHSKARMLAELKFKEALRRMNIDGALFGYRTTESFFNSFKNYMKTAAYCENSDMEKCFVKEIKSGDETFKISELKTSDDLWAKFDSNLISFKLINGTSVVMGYNPECTYIDQYDISADVDSCVTLIYDINGRSKPNKVGDDIGLINAKLGGCIKYNSNLCWSTVTVSEWVPTDEPCYRNGVDECAPTSTHPNGSNYWAGARDYCAELGMSLPTYEQAKDLYYPVQGGDVDEYSEGVVLMTNEVESFTWSAGASAGDTADVFNYIIFHPRYSGPYGGIMTLNRNAVGFRCVR